MKHRSSRDIVLFDTDLEVANALMDYFHRNGQRFASTKQEGRTREELILPLIARLDPEARQLNSALKDVFFAHLARYLELMLYRWVPFRHEGLTAARYRNGGYFALHVDDGPGLHSGARTVSGLYCPNDDYEGGEILFPRQAVEVRLKKGTLAFFPGNFLYPHCVRQVTRGTKYVVFDFFREQDEDLDWNGPVAEGYTVL